MKIEVFDDVDSVARPAAAAIAADDANSLQRQGGLSLGASTPALRRLIKAKLVTVDEKASATRRPRHVYKVTESGGKTASFAWISTPHSELSIWRCTT